MSQGLAPSIESTLDTPRSPRRLQPTVFTQWRTGEELATQLGIDSEILSDGIEAGAVDHLHMDCADVYRLRDRRGTRRPSRSPWRGPDRRRRTSSKPAVVEPVQGPRSGDLSEALAREFGYPLLLSAQERWYQSLVAQATIENAALRRALSDERHRIAYLEATIQALEAELDQLAP